LSVLVVLVLLRSDLPAQTLEEYPAGASCRAGSGAFCLNARHTVAPDGELWMTAPLVRKALADSRPWTTQTGSTGMPRKHGSKIKAILIGAAIGGGAAFGVGMLACNRPSADCRAEVFTGTVVVFAGVGALVGYAVSSP
jgi:hypothetical protein